MKSHKRSIIPFPSVACIGPLPHFLLYLFTLCSNVMARIYAPSSPWSLPFWQQSPSPPASPLLLAPFPSEKHLPALIRSSLANKPLTEMSHGSPKVKVSVIVRSRTRSMSTGATRQRTLFVQPTANYGCSAGPEYHQRPGWQDDARDRLNKCVDVP